MHNSEYQIYDRLGSAVYRLTQLEATLRPSTDSRRVERAASEVRRIIVELERTLLEAREADASRRRLREAAEQATQRAEQLFQLSSAPCFVLDRAGTICDANPAAARMTNLSRRHLVGRAFLLFIAADRQGFLGDLSSLEPGGEPVSWSITLRPRERAGRQVTVAAVADRDEHILIMLKAAEDELAEPISA